MNPVVAILIIIGIVLIPTAISVILRSLAGAAAKGVSASKQNELQQRQRDLEQ